MMKTHTKTSLIAVFLLISIAAGSLTACKSRPQLKQVASDAQDKPINTEDVSNQLKKKYEK